MPTTPDAAADRAPTAAAGVDALLATLTSQPALPPPDERLRLRNAAGWTKAAVARALTTTTAAVTGFETGAREPQGEIRAQYARLLDGIAAHHPPTRTDTTVPEPAAEPKPEPKPVPAQRPAPAATAAMAGAPAEAPAAPQQAAADDAAVQRRPRRTPPCGSPLEHLTLDRSMANGPLLVLDGDGQAYGAGGLVLQCPATSLVTLVEWTLTQGRLGAPKLDPHTRNHQDPVVVLTPGASTRLGLPDRLEDRARLRLPEDHPAVTEITDAGWTLTGRGVSNWTRVYGTDPNNPQARTCVVVAVVAWGALDPREWHDAADLPAPELAHTLCQFADLMITPSGSAGVIGVTLMEALNPPTHGSYKDPVTRAIVKGRCAAPGSRPVPTDPSLTCAPLEHPLLAAKFPRGHRAPGITITVSYRHADQHPTQGTLVSGRSVRIKNGTVFNVTSTDKS